METLAGVTVSFVISLLASATVTPLGGAGADNVTGKGTDCPGPTVRLGGRSIVPGLTTVTGSLVSAIFGKSLAWMVALPSATLVTGTVALVDLAGKATVAGTVAT
jgi:hypothetical protein